MAALRSFVPLSMVLLGIGFAAVSVAPPVAADCHCSVIGCLSKVVRTEEDAVRDKDADGYLTKSEMGVCTNSPRTDLWLGTVVMANGATMGIHLLTDAVAADGDGSVFLGRGANATLGFVVEGNGTGRMAGNVTLEAPAGMALSGPATVPFDSDHGPALFGFLVDAEAPDLLTVPYTVRADGVEPVAGEVELTPVDSIAVDGDELLAETERAPGPGALLGLAAIAVAAVAAARRRR